MLAIIPARGGSKGVPHKNIKMICGKPLIAYTIESAYKSGIFERVIVSTDDLEIARISEKYGAEVPFIRPDSIAGDDVSSDDVILHALEFYDNKVDYVCKLQPTSPLRTEADIINAYNLLQEKDADFIVSVCECEHSPLWTGVLNKDLCMDEFIDEDVKRLCRQNLPRYYRLNGAIYMARTKKFIQNRSFFGKKSYAFVMSQESSVDIDSEMDFLLAEQIIRNTRIK